MKVAVIDPLYLALLAGGKGDSPDARSLYEMGATFRAVATRFKTAGITPVLAHHANRRGEPNKPMELEHLAYSGISEFSRQWILLSRRKKYEGDGRHELWVGSAGQSGLYAADINEGTMSDDFSGRVWEVEVHTAAEVREESQAAKGSKKEDATRERNMRDDRDALAAIDAETSSGAEAATKAAIRLRCPRLHTTKIGEALARLIDMGIVEPVRFAKPGGRGSQQEVDGYRRVTRGGER